MSTPAEHWQKLPHLEVSFLYTSQPTMFFPEDLVKRLTKLHLRRARQICKSHRRLHRPYGLS